MATSINDLPNEVIQHIIRHIPPLSIIAFQRVCHRFNNLADSLIWRELCRSHFKYWSPEHDIKKKFISHVDDVDWKSIFVHRFLVNNRTTECLNSILSTQMGRIDKFQRIVALGYDAKDCLLSHMRVGDGVEDVLARRYYSDAVMGCLHRTLAIREWSKIQNLNETSLERGLAAYDMFVLHDGIGDFDEISESLDSIASSIRMNHSDFEVKTTRQRAIAIVKHLRENNITGLNQDQNQHFHDLQNNFIGVALHHYPHCSMPLISTAIFCCVAKRLGLDAHACGFPFHVVAIIRPPDGFDLDGNCRPASGTPAPRMYLDPYASEVETPMEDLVARLQLVGASKDKHIGFLEPSSTSDIILRTSRNILTSVQQSHRHAMGRQGGHDPATNTSSFPDMESAFYAALWASLLLGIPPDGDGPVHATVRRRNLLPPIVEHFETHFPTDVGLIEQHIVPLFQNLVEYAQLRESVRVMRTVDSMPKQVKRRTNEISQHVKYKVGQVFVHKRYNYHGVVTGWDVECGADEHWMAQMRIHELSRGKHQSFYHVMVEDKTVRYVAEENIEPVSQNVPYGLMNLAGRYFKRWDTYTGRFVSNIRDEYPDD